MDKDLLLFILFWGIIIVLSIVVALAITIKVCNVIYNYFFKDYFDNDNESH